jgi:hypothetical protein
LLVLIQRDREVHHEVLNLILLLNVPGGHAKGFEGFLSTVSDLLEAPTLRQILLQLFELVLPQYLAKDRFVIVFNLDDSAEVAGSCDGLADIVVVRVFLVLDLVECHLTREVGLHVYPELDQLPEALVDELLVEETFRV